MKTKPYPQSEEKPMVAGEPTVTYQRTAPTTYRQDVLPHEPVRKDEEDEAFEAFMNADLSELGNGFRPFTMSELNRWMDEVEAEDEDEAIPHEEVMRGMRELILSYAKYNNPP